MAKESATDADVAAMLAHEPPTTQSGRCLSACIMETVGVVSDCAVAFKNQKIFIYIFYV